MLKNSVIGGIIAGLLTVATLYILYQLHKPYMLYMLPYWGTLVFYALAMLGVNLLWKNQHSGILAFRRSIQLSFVVFLVANVIFFLFYYWIFNSDQELVVIQKEMMETFAESFPIGSEQRKQMESVEISSTEITIGHCINKYARGAIGGFLLSALIALLVKQNK